MMRPLAVLLILLIFGAPLQVAQGVPPTQVSANGLDVKVFPIYAPDINNNRDCTEGSIAVSRTDGQPFSNKDGFNLRSTFPENRDASVYHVQNGLRGSDGIPIGAGTKYVTIWPFARELPKTVALNFNLCTRDFLGWNINQIPKVLNVEIEYLKDLATPVAKVTVPVQIIPRNSEAILISEIREECGQDLIQKKFTYNMTVKQTGVPKKSGDLVEISGTLFRHGFPSPNDEIALLIESKKYADPRTPVAKTQTDSKGQFRFSFPIVREKGSKSSHYVVVAHQRAEPIGPIAGPFDEMAYSILFYWEPTATYSGGVRDWIPTHTKACKEKIDLYTSLMTNQPIKLFEDDRNRLLWFTAKSAYYGFKGKPDYASHYEWNQKTGGSCFVSGYTTSSGKRVGSYFRRCR